MGVHAAAPFSQRLWRGIPTVPPLGAGYPGPLGLDRRDNKSGAGVQIPTPLEAHTHRPLRQSPLDNPGESRYNGDGRNIAVWETDFSCIGAWGTAILRALPLMLLLSHTVILHRFTANFKRLRTARLDFSGCAVFCRCPPPFMPPAQRRLGRIAAPISRPCRGRAPEGQAVGRSGPRRSKRHGPPLIGGGPWWTLFASANNVQGCRLCRPHCSAKRTMCQPRLCPFA